MDLDDIMSKKSKLEAEANKQIQDALKDLRNDLSKSNEDVAKQLEEKEVTKDIPNPLPPPPRSPSIKQPLIYFSYPMSGYSEQPAWVDPLRQVLMPAGYLIYNPWDNVDAQFGQQDIPLLNSLPLRVMKALCPALAIPEEVLLPFDAVWKILQRGDTNDNFSIVFQCLWFLTRSSLVICDLMRPMAGAGTAQELLYSRQLGIPVVGLFPTTGQLNPFVHRSTTILFTDTDLISLLPLIKGFAPNT